MLGAVPERVSLCLYTHHYSQSCSAIILIEPCVLRFGKQGRQAFDVFLENPGQKVPGQKVPGYRF